MAKRTVAPAPKAFRTPAAFRAWLEKHHATATELELQLFKVHAAHRGITYAQALDEALCFGWIDGVVHRFDEDSFRQRFTPRKPRSAWSRRNVGHVERLRKAGRMAPDWRHEARDEAHRHPLVRAERPELTVREAYAERSRLDALPGTAVFGA
jgi:uncharacterized protein YdeI (YjbR/CyaY-like superfamily)